jgi:hypothetical protein
VTVVEITGYVEDAYSFMIEYLKVANRPGICLFCQEFSKFGIYDGYICYASTNPDKEHIFAYQCKARVPQSRKELLWLKGVFCINDMPLQKLYEFFGKSLSPLISLLYPQPMILP